MVRLMLAGLVGLLAAGSARAGAADYFRETVKDFGTTPRGPVLVHYFAVANTSAQPVTIGQPRVSCGCVSASVLNPQLAPGQATAVVAYMDTNRIPTPGVTKSVTVYVPFLAPVAEEVQLRVQTVTRTDLMINPDTVALGAVRFGQGGAATIKVSFLSDPNWQITEAKSTGVYLKPTVKPAGTPGTYDLTVALDPACPVGNWTADIHLTTTGAGVEKLRVPVTVAVTAAISVNPQAVAFGDVPAGKPAEKQVILQSPTPFAVKEVKAAAPGLTVKPVADGARPTHILKLSFSPTAAGPAKSAFEVLTDSKDQPVVRVPWTANVVK